MEVIGKAVCLVYSQHVSVLKEYNLCRHYETLHAIKYNNFQGQQRREEVNELLVGLKKQ